jgi:hypothetical protein
MTIGDAIASFLEKEDATTEQFPLLSLRDCRKGYSSGTKSWCDARYLWKDATSKGRRTITFAMHVSSNRLMYL